MKRFFLIFWFSILCFYLNAQNKPEKKEPSQIKGVKITYLPKESKLANLFQKVDLKVGDVVLSYANFPITEEKMLLGIDKFLMQLEQQWEKEGKAEDFWKKKSEWIKKKTRGTSINPVAFEEEKPIYQISIKRKQSDTNQWKEKTLALNCGLFFLLFQEKQKIETKALEIYRLALKAYQKGNLELALEHLKGSLKLREQVGNLIAIAQSFNNIGLIYQNQGKLVEALEHYKKSLKLFKEIEDSAEIATLLNNIGLIYQQQGNLKLALEYLQDSLKRREQVGNPKAIANSYNNIGLIYQSQGKLELALKHYNDSLKLYKQVGKSIDIATCINNIGLIYQIQGKLEEALESYKSSLKLYKQAGDPAKIATSINNIGFVYRKQGKLEEALECYKNSLKLYEQVGDSAKIALSLNNIGAIYYSQGELTLALKFYKNSLELREQVGNPAEIAQSFNNIGFTYQQQGKLEEALDCYKNSLKLKKQVGNPAEIAISLNNIGLIYQNQGKLEEALAYYQKSLKLYEQVGNPAKIAINLNNIGLIYQNQGKLEEALKYCVKSLRRREQVGAPEDIATSLNNIGFIYQQQGKLEEALRHYTNSLRLREQIEIPADIAISLNNIGLIYQEQGKLEEALKRYINSLQLFEQSGTPAEIATSLGNIGFIYQIQGNFELALEHLKGSLKLRKQVGDPTQIASSLNNIGAFHSSQGKLELALEHFKGSLKLYEQVGNPAKIATLLNNIGLIYQQQEKLDLTLDYFLKSIKKLNYVANRAGSGRESYFKTHLYKYFSVIEFLTEHAPEKAFETLQYCKAFGFLTQLSELDLSLEKYSDIKLIQQKNSLNAQISATYKLLGKLLSKKSISKSIIVAKKKTLQLLENQLEEIVDKIRLGNPEYSNIQYPKPATLNSIRAILKKDELFLEYFWGTEALYCFVISKELFKVIKLNETEKLNGEIKIFRRFLWESQQEVGEVKEYYEQATKLYNNLLKKALSHFKTKQIKHLIIAPDGKLNILAFDSLVISQEETPRSYKELHYVLDDYELSYTTSATVYKHIYDLYSTSKKRDSLSFFGIGDPNFEASKEKQDKFKIRTRSNLTPLPGTRKELKKISSLFPQKNQKILLGQDSIEPTFFLEDLLHYNILHFATHGIIDTKKPMYSSLALTQLTDKQQMKFKKALQEKGLEPISCSDGFLQMREIFSLHKKINAELVVLSACETATGKLEKGDGIVGLTRAFQFAGTPSIVVSLWAVADESTNQLMQAFYQEMLKDNPISLKERRLSALHFAKKKLRNSEKHNAPFYWAPFILRGLK